MVNTRLVISSLLVPVFALNHRSKPLLVAVALRFIRTQRIAICLFNQVIFVFTGSNPINNSRFCDLILDLEKRLTRQRHKNILTLTSVTQGCQSVKVQDSKLWKIPGSGGKKTGRYQRNIITMTTPPIIFFCFNLGPWETLYIMEPNQVVVTSRNLQCLFYYVS